MIISQFQHVAELLPEATLLVTVDADGTILAWNQSATRLFGFPIEKREHQRLSDEVEAADADALSRYLRTCSKSRSMMPGAFRILRKNGQQWQFEGAMFRPRTHEAPAVILLRLFPKTEGTSKFSALNRQVSELSQEVRRRRYAEEGAKQLKTQAQDKLDTTTHQLNAFVDSCHDAIISIDADHRILRFNQGAAHIFGYATEELMGQPIDILLPAHAKHTHRRQVTNFLHMTDTSRLMGTRREITGVRKTGEVFPAEASISKVLVGGQWIFTAILRDITERRQSEQRFAVEHAVARILESGTSFTRVAPEILQTVCALLGWRFGALWQRDSKANVMRNVALWHDYSADCSAFVAMSLAITLTEGEGLVGRVWAAGNPAWIRDVGTEPNLPHTAVAEQSGLHAALAFPITIGGTIHGVMEFYSDRVQDLDEGLLRVMEALGSQMGQFVERMQAEKALSYTQFAIDRAVDPTFFIRKDGSFFYVNEAACRLLGHSKDELYTMHILDIAPSQSLATWEIHWQKTSTGKIPTYPSQCRTKEGRVFPVEVTLNSLEYDGLEYTCVSVRDVTERTQLESRLRQTQKMEAIGQLAGGIAHDFNNILTAILGYSQVIKSQLPEGGDLHAHAGEVLIAANRAKDLVKQILTFSRQGDDYPKPIAVIPIVEEALALLRASLPATIEIRTTLDPACGNIMADPTQIHQVIMNLCTNAAHAMCGGKGVIELDLRGAPLPDDPSQARPAGSYVQIRIRDTGHGLPPEILEHIFDPFFTTKAVNEGTGLGLSVIHGVVTRYNGTITVESVVGEGTTFELRFPLIKAESSEEAAPSAPAPPRGTECLLLVDDEPALLQMYQKVLAKYGYTVEGRTNSTEALELFRQTPDRFDVVITDQTMPQMTGAELSEAILQIRPEMPIILCTGYSASLSPQIAKAMGISKYVMKPLIIPDLARIIRKVCDQPQKNDAAGEATGHAIRARSTRMAHVSGSP